MQELHIDKARQLVFDYAKKHLDKTDSGAADFTIQDVYVVWFNFTLGNWKALLSTSLLDGMYYEVTFNATRGETYLDAYKKFDNQVYLNSNGHL